MSSRLEAVAGCRSRTLTVAAKSILTIGFGDMAPHNQQGRGFLFIWEVVGIIFLGLVISSITKFAGNIGSDKIIKMHRNQRRRDTLTRTVTSEDELWERLGLPLRRKSEGDSQRPKHDSVFADQLHGHNVTRRTSLDRYGHLEVAGRKIVFHRHSHKTPGGGVPGRTNPTGTSRPGNIKLRGKDGRSRIKSDTGSPAGIRRRQKMKLLLLREERDRFDTMREIENDTRRFRRYSSLIMAVIAFALLWCLGALVFYYTEHRTQQISYYEALYFCWVSLLTIG